jgi:hypothetical protein
MIVLLYILTLCCAVNNAIFFAGLIALIMAIKRLAHVSEHHTTDTRMLIFVPVLQEQSVIRGAIQHLKTMACNWHSIRIVIVTTEKEVLQKVNNRAKLARFISLRKDFSDSQLEQVNNGVIPIYYLPALQSVLNRLDGCIDFNPLYEFYDSIPTTYDLAQAEIEQVNRELGLDAFICIHYPRVVGGKPSQLNFALEEIKKISPEFFETDAYIGVYDCDSLPDVRTFGFIIREVERRRKLSQPLPAMFQQIDLALNFRAPITYAAYAAG